MDVFNPQTTRKTIKRTFVLIEIHGNFLKHLPYKLTSLIPYTLQYIEEKAFKVEAAQ